MKEPATLTLSGSMPLTKQTSALKTGWNLICAPTDTSIEASKALAGVTYSSLRGAEVAAGGEAIYTEVTTLQKGHAYWVHVTTDQAWNIPLSEVETEYSYDGDGGRVLRQQDCELTVYIGSLFELQGTAGETANKVTKFIFMGDTRITSIETIDNVTHAYYYHQDHIKSSNEQHKDKYNPYVHVLEVDPVEYLGVFFLDVGHL